MLKNIVRERKAITVRGRVLASRHMEGRAYRLSGRILHKEAQLITNDHTVGIYVPGRRHSNN